MASALVRLCCILQKPNPGGSNDSDVAAHAQPKVDYLRSAGCRRRHGCRVQRKYPAFGFSVSILHDGTWTTAPICYLEDLFVDPEYRGRGFGRLLIQDLVDRAKSRGWSRLYWHTQAANPARHLYDEYVAADDFVRYRVVFDGG